MTKGMEWNDKIEYAVKPKPIEVKPYEVEAIKRFGFENVMNSHKAILPKMAVIIKTEEQDK